MRKKGFTLAETLVYSGIALVVTLLVYDAFQGGVDLQSRADAQINIHTGVRSILLTMGKELEESNILTISVYNTAPQGIIFASPRDPNNNLQFDSEGYIYWYKYICYYVDSDSTSDTGYSFYRKELPMPYQTTTAQVSTWDINYFKVSPSPGQLICKNISSISFSLSGTVTATLTVSKNGRGGANNSLVNLTYNFTCRNQ
ncbi:MAG: hypothetical protein M1536_00220 [Firmicutes bacterium]|nr:hypothetical protein [Bacillota bacterium]